MKHGGWIVISYQYQKKLRTPLSGGSSLCEGMGEGCCTQSYPCICKEAISGFELMTNKSPRHNFTNIKDKKKVSLSRKLYPNFNSP